MVNIRYFLLGQLTILLIIICLGTYFKMGIDMGDIATWFGSLGTIAALGLAYYQLHTDRLATREDEKRNQAKKISVWIDSENRNAEMCYSIQNVSDSPVYQGIITLVGIQGAGPPKCGENVDEGYEYRVKLVTIPPGKFYAVSNSGGKGMHIEYGVEIAFTDSNGIHWLRRSNGKLEEIKKSPLEFYSISLPVGWSKVKEEKPESFTT
ncbi:hypothetical protein FUA19_06440 [Bacillus subtilis]|nr:hypothetical protein FUA19_06440 [Bacillus subtilis]